MVTVSSAFISSRRERIRFSVLSASDGAGKAAAWVDVLRALCRDLGKTDLDNTDVARDHSFHCIARAESSGSHGPFYACGVNSFNIQYPVSAPRRVMDYSLTAFQLPSGFLKPVDDRLSFNPVRKTQAGARVSASF